MEKRLNTNYSSGYFINHATTKTKLNFSKVEKYTSYSFDLPEFDSLIYEISYCLMIECYQSALTLTNHLLEKLLKYSLIYKNVINKAVDDLNILNEKYEEFIDQYGSLKLEDTINRCCSLRLITKNEKKVLKIFKDKYRNSFSHADIKETFGTISVPITMGNFQTGKITTQLVKVSNFIFLHGLIQAMIAEEVAPKYFDYVYNILYRILNDIFPRE
jgi:hypothetical protein